MYCSSHFEICTLFNKEWPERGDWQDSRAMLLWTWGKFFNFQRPVLLPTLLSGDARGWKHWLSKLVFNWKLAGLRALHYSSPRQESSASYIPSAAEAGAAAASRAGRKRERERGKADRYIGQRNKATRSTRSESLNTSPNQPYTPSYPRSQSRLLTHQLLVSLFVSVKFVAFERDCWEDEFAF